VSVAESADGSIRATLPNGQVIRTDPIPRNLAPDVFDTVGVVGVGEYWQNNDLTAPPTDYERRFRESVGLAGSLDFDSYAGGIVNYRVQS